MKKMNQFMMGMLAIAATSFVSCSNEDAINGNTAPQSVENFYMNLKVVGNTSNGTRTTGTPTENGSDAESKITSGTIWLVDASGKVKFSKKITAEEWNSTDNTATNPIKVAVTQVEENTPYKVYFLANKTDVDLNADPTTQTFTSTTGGIDYATDNAFVMFNQNDKAMKADQYTVTFTGDNKDATNPAKPAEAIKLDRLTARIDVPTTVTTITKDDTKTDGTENIEAITGLTFDGFATSNLAKKANMEQKWDATAWTTLQVPTDLTYYWDKGSYGTELKAELLENFQKDNVQYLFEQTTNDVDKATSIYLQYTAVASTDGNKDFTDGTFYRYDKHVFTSIEDIIKYAGAANPFGDKTAAEVVDEIKDATKPTETVCTEDQSLLETFRDTYKIEVFVAGKVYYRYAIKDPSHDNYTILRNSIYKINVQNIYDLGTDTPNGGDDQVKPVYYLNVEVTVNPWVLKTINVDLD